MRPQVVLAICLSVLLFSCSASQHRDEVRDDGDRLTVGTVQKEIRKGMSGAEVAEALGSPNIVTTDETGGEVWIYDKISTEKVYSTSNGSVLAIFLTPLGAAAGGAGGSASRSAGAASTSQRTLTIIIKYDQSGAVRDFAYHSSRF